MKFFSPSFPYASKNHWTSKAPSRSSSGESGVYFAITDFTLSSKPSLVCAIK
jgi:hypothetical protein